MARIRGENTRPELELRRAVWSCGLRYRLRERVFGTQPDLLFSASKVAVFVDGCFWHGCPIHYSRPRSRTEFWAVKLSSNIERDSRHTLQLEREGWRVVRLWEHDVWSDLEQAVERVRSAVEDATWRPQDEWRVVRVDAEPRAGPHYEKRELRLLRNESLRRFETGPRVTGGSKGRKQ